MEIVAGTAREHWYGGNHIWGLEQGSRRALGRTEFKRWVVTYRLLAEAVLYGCSPAQLFPLETYEEQGGQAIVSTSGNSFPKPACPSVYPHQPHPHSSWISGIKSHSMCGQAKGVARGWPGRRGGTGPLPFHWQPPHRIHLRLRTESPRPQELEQRLQEPHGVHSLWTLLWGERVTVSLEGRLANPTPQLGPHAPGPMSPFT